ncbi:MAG: hypothetical protein LBG06_13055 [Deltaproteobacteria bacterium]|nr:hypothetical protein [Deltaproteobacteria bacterium]
MFTSVWVLGCPDMILKQAGYAMRSLRLELLRDLARRTRVHAGETGRLFSGRRLCAGFLGTAGDARLRHRVALPGDPAQGAG